jgi:hypothetical protein
MAEIGHARGSNAAFSLARGLMRALSFAIYKAFPANVIDEESGLSYSEWSRGR